MNNAEKRTPGPWKVTKEPVDKEEIGFPAFLALAIAGQDDDDQAICVVSPLAALRPADEANAAFIVRACNSYDSDQAKIKALVEALDAIDDEARQFISEDDPEDNDPTLEWISKRATTALSLVKGE